ncbi:MAG: energy-coupling factor ABC transporter permease [Clostridium chrysemydis]|uniref:energy-coupling factor ABC transporter permease n=1 Tax=Clostridium TaxID=1485 RepID=UPI002152D760|nr:energy-coupling factor ABC transporter permease [Clostridium sp. LY3-2]MCR6515510.1 energy-coupling factor ABC transporter permease [Clostridium sp. LY3-2]
MKKLFVLFYGIIIALTIPMNAYAMHISEGAISLNWCLFYYAVSLPFVVISFKEVREVLKNNVDVKMLLALMAAFIFLMSALKLPSVTGSSSHPTGTGLGAILFGPFKIPLLSVIVLLFQALLLAHGGLTTLGANTLSMGIVGPIVSYLIFKLLKNKNKTLAVFLGCALGDLATYVVTSIQLALAYPDSVNGFLSSFIKFAGIFAVSQVPLAIVEGLVSVVIYDYVIKHCKGELKEINGGL